MCFSATASFSAGTILLVFVAAGLAVGAYLLYFLIALPIVSRPTGQHIEYVSPRC